MENKLLEIDLNEADEYDFDDFTQNLEYELFEHKIEFPITLEAVASNWRGQTGYAEAESQSDLINKISSFDPSYVELCINTSNLPAKIERLPRKNMIHEYNPETKKYSQIIVKNITEKESTDKIWSLGTNDGLEEVNSYMLTLQEAIDMIKPAIKEDGYNENDLYIFRNIQEPEAVDNDLYPLYFKIYTHDVPMGFRMNLKKSGENNG